MPKRKMAQKSSPITKKKIRMDEAVEKEEEQSSHQDELNIHVLELIAKKIGMNPHLLRFSAVNSRCQFMADRLLSRRNDGITVDVNDFNQSKMFLDSEWYSAENKSNLNFHKDVREMVAILSIFSEKLPTDQNVLKHFSLEALGWLTGHNEAAPKRCPHLLQKKILKLFFKFNGTTEFRYEPALLRPSRFVRLFKLRLDTVTALDLGEMKNLKAVGLRTGIFSKLVNLKELVWHSAEMWFVEALPYPHKLESLCFTLILKGIHGETLRSLMNCQGLKRLHSGIHRPPMNRLVWTVVLKSYQAFWNQKQYNPEDVLVDKGIVPVPLKNSFDECDFTYRAFPKLEKLSFWDTPEYLFVTMSKENFAYKELQLGLLTQDLQSLCSLDSIMQAFFKYIQADNLQPLNADHLKLYTHSMPVVHLDYYLPYLMDVLGQCLPDVQTIDLFVHCLISSQSMPGSWIRDEKRQKKPLSRFCNLTKFNFHIDGFCVLKDLDTYLPDTLQSISLSFIQPADEKKKFIFSLLEFIKNLGDFNRFPELDELHIQVWGFASFEPIANAITDYLPSLKRLSIITHSNKKTETTIELIGRLVEKSPQLVEIGLSDQMVKQLAADENTKDHWRTVLFNLGERCGIKTECNLTIRRLPEQSDWNRYTVAPPQIDEKDEDECMNYEEEEEKESEYDEDEEEDSFIVKDDQISEDGSEDEIDIAEKALEEEDEKDHKRWQKRAKIDSECSEKSDENAVIVFRRKRTGLTSDEEEDEEEEDEERNPFLDDEAEEKNEESEVEDETEPEGEDITQTDDEDLFENQVQLMNVRLQRRPASQQKRRLIIESDSD